MNEPASSRGRTSFGPGSGPGYWLPVVGWMALIFVLSTDTFSGGQTSRILAPLLRWLFPGLSEHASALGVFGVRKAAHVIVYAVLAWLWWRALRRPVRHDPRPWQWRPAGLALLFSASYAVSDEFHQSFTTARTPSAWDVLLDTAGAAAGLLVLWRFGRWRRWW